jgi:hypothetical protein
MRKAQTVVIETNHDEKLLQEDTKRPWSVKQRIMSRHGHLSNAAAANVLADLLEGQLRRAVLGHLSRDCNSPELAVGTVRTCLDARGGTKVDVICATQREVSARMQVGGEPMLGGLAVALPLISNRTDLTMPTLIPSPTRIHAAGDPPKTIEEYIGRVNSGTESVSVARMISPPGWSEPGQTPEFDEYTGRPPREVAGRNARWSFGSERRAGDHHASRGVDPLQHAGRRRGVHCRVSCLLSPRRPCTGTTPTNAASGRVSGEPDGSPFTSESVSGRLKTARSSSIPM